jgi:uncharacterized Tic20 family protein
MDTKDLLGDESMPAITPSSDEKILAILSHILCVVVGLGFIPPLIIYLLKKDESAYVKAHALESLNFQITLLLICIILFITIIGWLLLWAVGIINLILVIVATIKASENKMYRYPINFRLIK